MDQAITTYTEELEMGASLVKKVLEWRGICKNLAGHEMTGLFISDAIAGDGTRDYPNLFFVDDTYLFDVNAFTANNSVRVVKLRNSCHLSIMRWDFDFAEFTSSSKAQAQIVFVPPQYSVTMVATRSNCQRLAMIVKKLFLAPGL
jgi:hypothetical protein